MTQDVNVDLGELEGPDGRARELALLPYATRINVACGFHAGDAATMRVLCEAAREHGVLVGAHISYRDRAHFGRRSLQVDPATLATEATEQLRTLAAAGGVPLVHVKPHGALYHHLAPITRPQPARSPRPSPHDPDLAVLTMPGIAALAAAAAALRPAGAA